MNIRSRYLGKRLQMASAVMNDLTTSFEEKPLQSPNALQEMAKSQDP